MSRLIKHLPKIAVLVFVLGGGALLASKMMNSASVPGAQVAVTVPTLTAQAARGSVTFKKICAQCHGDNGAGSDKGPPLIHDIYNPGHHGDGSFYNAVSNGVQQHHWPYGNMPPQPKVKANDIGDIIAYVREVQMANGIVTREHRM
ncbi:c-type cytochrome [Magnetovibrio blakemorei]|uniref:Cytochrome C n=1 Tax=Magnetovibrio blakemorei TaxID=28181 RepID=A0A1E5QB45_9PROT|nr:cytochrome c [Magnetovibrio blakemorei]OEJ69229.1 cytochrome C [Magnetovibrio blakemorei]